MIMEKRGARGNDANVQVAASKRFERYAPETHKSVRPLIVDAKDSKGLQEIKDAWQKIYKEPSSVWGSTSDDYFTVSEKYAWMQEQISGIKCSSGDIESFCVAFPASPRACPHFPERLGLFLSALINNCGNPKYRLCIIPFEEDIALVGHKNSKNITILGNPRRDVGNMMGGGDLIVEGNGGYSVGSSMVGGTITITGDARLNVGYYMRGGSIVVQGNAGDNVGHGMGGGIIRINGNVGFGVGDGMEGGEIHIDGEIGGISDSIRHGKIFHKGVLIVDK